MHKYWHTHKHKYKYDIWTSESLSASKPGLNWVAGNVGEEYCNGQTCKMGLLADKLSEVQMSYFYLCLSVCQYLWIIKFLEWAYRKKSGGEDMRGYFHRLGYWGFIYRLILLRFSFVFFIYLPIRKSYRMVLSFRFWALFDYWIFPTCHV